MSKTVIASVWAEEILCEKALEKWVQIQYGNISENLTVFINEPLDDISKIEKAYVLYTEGQLQKAMRMVSDLTSAYINTEINVLPDMISAYEAERFLVNYGMTALAQLKSYFNTHAETQNGIPFAELLAIPEKKKDVSSKSHSLLEAMQRKKIQEFINHGTGRRLMVERLLENKLKADPETTADKLESYFWQYLQITGSVLYYPDFEKSFSLKKIYDVDGCRQFEDITWDDWDNEMQAQAADILLTLPLLGATPKARMKVVYDAITEKIKEQEE